MSGIGAIVMFEVHTPIDWRAMMKDPFAQPPHAMNREQRRKAERNRKKRKKVKIRRAEK